MVTRQTPRHDRQADRESQTPRERAIEAYDGARRKAAGQARLDELGLTKDKGTETIRSLLESAGDAAKASAEAAVSAIRGPKD